MEDKIIRSRRPLHQANSGNYSPPHGSPIRSSGKHLSPNLSGSDDNDEMYSELMDIGNCSNEVASSSSTINSSVDDGKYRADITLGIRYREDVTDGTKYDISYSHTKSNVRVDENGKIRGVEQITIKKTFVVAKKDESRHNAFWWIVLIVVVGLAVYFSTFHGNVDAESRTGQLLRCSFEQVQRDFPNQNKILWKSLEHGVESVLNDIPTTPSIFLLAYAFKDVDTVNRITRSIVERTTECMNSKVNALELNPADLAQNEMKTDYGVVITKYKNQLRRSGVMLVNDLNKVPSEVAPAFHVFCDVQNPLVDRSIIFLTLQLTQQVHTGSNTNALQLVENYLRSNWSELEKFILEPLITRVTDQVFILNEE